MHQAEDMAMLSPAAALYRRAVFWSDVGWIVEHIATILVLISIYSKFNSFVVFILGCHLMQLYVGCLFNNTEFSFDMSWLEGDNYFYS